MPAETRTFMRHPGSAITIYMDFIMSVLPTLHNSAFHSEDGAFKPEGILDLKGIGFVLKDRKTILKHSSVVCTK